MFTNKSYKTVESPNSGMLPEAKYKTHVQMAKLHHAHLSAQGWLDLQCALGEQVPRGHWNFRV